MEFRFQSTKTHRLCTRVNFQKKSRVKVLLLHLTYQRLHFTAFWLARTNPYLSRRSTQMKNSQKLNRIIQKCSTLQVRLQRQSVAKQTRNVQKPVNVQLRRILRCELHICKKRPHFKSQKSSKSSSSCGRANSRLARRKTAIIWAKNLACHRA